MSGTPDERAENGDASAAMPWDPSAERTLTSLADMVPETLRQLARSAARDESELAAQERGVETVTAEDVLRGWIRTTPPEQRDGLVEVIDSLGFDPELFATDLESNEGWENTAEE